MKLKTIGPVVLFFLPSLTLKGLPQTSCPIYVSRALWSWLVDAMIAFSNGTGGSETVLLTTYTFSASLCLYTHSIHDKCPFCVVHVWIRVCLHVCHLVSSGAMDTNRPWSAYYCRRLQFDTAECFLYVSWCFMPAGGRKSLRLGTF